MKYSKWIVLFIMSSVFFIGRLPTVTPTAAFTSDSFSQEISDNYIWERTLCDNFTIGEDVGNRRRADVSTLNRTFFGPLSCIADSLYINGYRNYRIDRTWVSLGADALLSVYNSTKGFMASPPALIIPHNETAVNASVYSWMSGTYENYKWIPGPHGYDATVEGWDGSETGDLYAEKFSIIYNEEGVMQCQLWYNGTGSNWQLTDEEVLQTPLRPKLQTLVQSDNKVTLTWNPVTDVSFYYIYRSTSPITQQSWQEMVPLAICLPHITTWKDYEVPLGTYYYAVIAGNEAANSSISLNMQIVLTEPESGISGFIPAIFAVGFAAMVGIWRKRQKSLIV